MVGGLVDRTAAAVWFLSLLGADPDEADVDAEEDAAVFDVDFGVLKKGDDVEVDCDDDDGVDDFAAEVLVVFDLRSGLGINLDSVRVPSTRPRNSSRMLSSVFICIFTTLVDPFTARTEAEVRKYKRGSEEQHGCEESTHSTLSPIEDCGSLPNG